MQVFLTNRTEVFVDLSSWSTETKNKELVHSCSRAFTYLMEP